MNEKQEIPSKVTFGLPTDPKNVQWDVPNQGHYDNEAEYLLDMITYLEDQELKAMAIVYIQRKNLNVARQSLRRVLKQEQTQENEQ